MPRGDFFLLNRFDDVHPFMSSDSLTKLLLVDLVERPKRKEKRIWVQGFRQGEDGLHVPRGEGPVVKLQELRLAHLFFRLSFGF